MAVGAEMARVRKTALMRQIEVRFGEPIDALLRRLYVGENRTMREVAALLGIKSDSTVWLWLLKFDIPTRRWLLPQDPAAHR
jgi:hypothetical protein